MAGDRHGKHNSTTVAFRVNSYEKATIEENLGKADGGETGCDRTTENAGSDEMGWINEWHQSLCRRNCVEREGIYVSRKGDRKAALYKDDNKNC